jgi:hypothetical protein
MRADVESPSGGSKSIDGDIGEAVGAPLSCGKVYRRKLDLNICTHTTTHTYLNMPSYNIVVFGGK